MASTPIREQLDQALLTCVKQLVTGNSTPLTGYTTVLAGAEFWQHQPVNQVSHLTAVIWTHGEHTPQPDELLGVGKTQPLGKQEWLRTYSIVVWIALDESAAQTANTIANAAVADIQKIIVAEVKNHALLSGLCKNIFMRGYVIGPDPNDPLFVAVAMEVLYRVDEFDSYVLG